MSDDQVRPVSRRDFLKKGAALGGAVFWVTPAMRAVALEAHAAEPVSPLCNVWYAVKIERTLDGEGEPTAIPNCIEDYTGGGDSGQGDCLDVGELDLPSEVQNGCSHIAEAVLAEEGAAVKSWKITLDQDCRFLVGSDRCTIKSGSQCFSNVCEWDFATRTLTFNAPSGQDISHVEFVFCCNT